MRELVRSYLETALWSSNAWWKMDDESQNPPPCDEDYVIEDFSPEAVASATADCESFWEANRESIRRSGQDESSVGHDLWLTRNHHGAGFWDGDYGDEGEALTNSAHALGECNIDIGPDGKLRFV